MGEGKKRRRNRRKSREGGENIKTEFITAMVLGTWKMNTGQIWEQHRTQIQRSLEKQQQESSGGRKALTITKETLIQATYRNEAIPGYRASLCAGMKQ